METNMVNITLEKVDNGFVIDVHFNRSTENKRLVFEKEDEARKALIHYFNILGTTFLDEDN